MSETRKVQLPVTVEVEPDVDTSELTDAVLEALIDELDFAHSVEVGPAVTVPSTRPRRGLQIRLRFK